MSAAAAPQGTGRMDGIGKKELAAKLTWSRPKLDRRLLSDPHFPVLNRGDQSGGWLFDLAAVKAYLAGGRATPAPAAAPPAIDQAQLRDAVAPPVPQPAAVVTAHPGEATPPRKSAHHAGEASARQRKDEADAALRELKLANERGETILKSEVQQIAIAVFSGLGNDLDALPEELARKLDLPEDAASGIRKLLDDVRVAMAQRLEPLLSDG